MDKNKNLIGISGKSGSGKDLISKMINYHVIRGKSTYRGNIEMFLESYNDSIDIYPYQIHRFADKLKQIVSLLTGIPRENLEKEEIKERVLPQEWNYISKVVRYDDKFMIIPGIVDKSMEGRDHTLSVRELLQLMGTDACRNHIHENIWVNGLFTDYKPTIIPVGGTTEYYPRVENWPKWIIPDLRFKNEFHAIKDRGGLIIRIDRDYDKNKYKFKHQSETDLDDYRDKFDYIIDNNSTIEMLSKQVKTILTLEGII